MPGDEVSKPISSTSKSLCHYPVLSSLFTTKPKLINIDQCSLALAQIYLTIASLVRTVDLELGECDQGDIEIARDIQLSGVRKNTRGLVVTVTGKEQQTPKPCRETLNYHLAIWGNTWDI